MLVIVELISPCVLPVHATVDIIIVSSSGYLNLNGYYYVVGEVKNIGDKAYAASVSVTFFDSNNDILYVRTQNASLHVIFPDRKSPFDLSLPDLVKSAMVDHYTMVTNYYEVQSKPLGLVFLWNTSRFEPWGTYERIIVEGEIKNVGTQICSAVYVYATYYSGANGTGYVVESDSRVVISGWNPGETLSFSLWHVITPGRKPLYVSHAVTAESNEYALTPEFSPNMLLSIFVIVTLITVVLAKKKMLHR